MWTDLGPIVSCGVPIIKKKGLVWVRAGIIQSMRAEQKIKQDNRITIGQNIRGIRQQRGLGQTQLAAQIQLTGVEMTRETLVKIERGVRHIYASELRAFRDVLNTSYDELLK